HDGQAVDHHVEKAADHQGEEKYQREVEPWQAVCQLEKKCHNQPSVMELGKGHAVVSAHPRGSAYHVTQLEDGQVHGDDHAADQYPQHHHDKRLQQAGEAVDQVIDLLLEDGRDLGEHIIDGA